jgi:uncharacterized membrane protein YvbJ
MFCQKCGKENSDGTAFCSGCGTPLTVPFGKVAVIQAKINTKKEEMAGINQVGPFLLLVLGLLLLIPFIIPGLIVIGISVWWSTSREREKNKLKNAIKELEAELVT